MSVEKRRRCGFRKVGGLYLVASGSGVGCGRLPIPLSVCPTCSAGIKQTRGWSWVDLPGLVKNIPCQAQPEYCASCPLALPDLIGRVGLLWIGAQFYPTPADFQSEAAELGISRRIAAIPRGFKVGETWVLFAHPKTIRCSECNSTGIVGRLALPDEPHAVMKCEKCEGVGWIKGAFRLFRPERIEKIITTSQSKDAALVQELVDKGITPVIVPDNDPDHQGSVYDRPDIEEPEVAA